MTLPISRARLAMSTGSMKTYWLEGRDPSGRAVRSPHAEEVDELESPQLEDAVKEPSVRELEDDRRVYSPVTFQEIAKRSLASSPKRVAGKQGPLRAVQSRAKPLENTQNTSDVESLVQQRNDCRWAIQLHRICAANHIPQ